MPPAAKPSRTTVCALPANLVVRAGCAEQGRAWRHGVTAISRGLACLWPLAYAVSLDAGEEPQQQEQRYKRYSTHVRWISNVRTDGLRAVPGVTTSVGQSDSAQTS
jgi:hypothetical protein